MSLVLSIIFLLLLGVWVGRQEIAYSFAGLHVSEILSMKTFRDFLLLAFLTGFILMLLLPTRPYDISADHLYDVIAGIFLTILVVNSLNMHTSVVTAAWGALAGFVYFHYPAWGAYPFVTMLLSWLVVPLCSIPLTYLYYRKIEQVAKDNDKHLLTCFHHIRQVAFAGVIVCGIALTYNYFLLFYPMLTEVSEQIAFGRVGQLILLLIAMVLCFVAVVSRVRMGFGSKTMMNRHIATLYSLTTVIILSTLLTICLSLPAPLVLAANQVKECNNVFQDRDKRNVHLLNVTTISLLTPLLSFLISVLLASMMDDVYLKFATMLFIVMLSVLAHLYFNQWMKHRGTKLALSNELQRKEVADKEMNRLDVLAVTSQFNVLSKEIDLKQKELINLSLYLRQQRDYLEDMSKRLIEGARMENVEEMRKVVTQQANELRDNIRLSDEMDHFFTQVDEMHKNFVGRLMMRCPGISEREKRLAILLRLGYSSKEIGSLMNIETKSVEIGRYRLRKKLKMDRSENIVQYLQLL